MLAISPVDRIFVLTGAGVSAESGIPTFRGVNGLWRNYRIEEVASPHAWRRDPRLVWEFYSMRRRVAAVAKPNPAHVALAKLEHEVADRLFLCTQNVDDLHGRQDRSTSSTCTGNSSRAAVTLAASHILRHEHLRSSSRATPVRMWRWYSSAHLLVRRGTFRTGSHLPRTRRMHDLHGCGHIGSRGASGELCRPRWRSSANDLRGARGTCQHILVHGLPFGKRRRDVA